MLRLFTCLCFVIISTVANAQISRWSSEDPARVHMVVWRGCEEACRGFIGYIEDRNLPISVEVTDVARDSSRLPSIREELLKDNPDLVVTWGTSVSRALIGTRQEYGSASGLGSIPSVFMIVADPIGSDLVESFDGSGRENVTGVRNRVPEDAQLRLLFDYFRPQRLGVLNHPDELNSTLNTEKVRVLADALNFELLEEYYDPKADGAVPVEQIEAQLTALKRRGADAIYVGSSSYNLQHQQRFVAAATALELPVLSAYSQMAREGGALIAVGTSYANVGRLSAAQVSRVLLEGVSPGELPIRALGRFSIVVNLRSARRLGIFPPLQLLSIAEVVQ